MRLRALLGHGVIVQGRAWQDVEITALATDSRAVGPGMLFAALPGSRLDGGVFIPEALARGAAAVLADASYEGGDLGVPLILDPQPRRRLALIAARFYQKQPRCVVAVTGTNGKTSVVGFTRQLWTALGHPAASLGTLGLHGPAGLGAADLTTPDPIALHRLLAELADAGVDHLALEASSHGLDQHRLDGVRIQAAAFTNLSRDHFDYHGDLDHYLAAKQRLFGELLAAEGTAVLNADQPQFGQLAEVCRARGIAVLDYGRKAQRLRLVEQAAPRWPGADRRARRPSASGSRPTWSAASRRPICWRRSAWRWRPAPSRRPRFASLGGLRGAPGRLQRVGTHRAARRCSSTTPTRPTRSTRCCARSARTSQAGSWWCSAAAAIAIAASARSWARSRRSWPTRSSSPTTTRAARTPPASAGDARGLPGAASRSAIAAARSAPRWPVSRRATCW